MASNTYPAASASSSGPNTYTLTATTSNTYYESSVSLSAGIYTITCVSSTIAKVDFFTSNSTLLTTATTVSGSVTISIASAVTKVGIWTNTGSSVAVSLALTGQSISAAYNGTLDTITATQNYNQTGAMYVVVVAGGGGGGGGAGTNAGGLTAGAGGGGGVTGGFVYTNGVTLITVGAAGNAGAASGAYGVGNAAGAGGSSSFGATYVATGGTGGSGVNGSSQNNGGSGTAGGPGTSNPYNFVVSSLGNYGAAGTPGNNSNPAGNGNAGNAGGAGIVYVLRGL